MTLENALNYFKNRASETNKKSDLKVYREFIRILTSLQRGNLSEREIQSIEAELDSLDLNLRARQNKKYLYQALKHFKNYLKDTFSFTTEGYYTTLGIGSGASFGVLLGTVFLSTFERSLGISLGITLGMLIGLIVGSYMDAQAKASGKMI